MLEPSERAWSWIVVVIVILIIIGNLLFHDNTHCYPRYVGDDQAWDECGVGTQEYQEFLKGPDYP